jgi:hypothetical protein
MRAPVITGVNILDTKTAAISASLVFNAGIDTTCDYCELEIINLMTSNTSTTPHPQVSQERRAPSRQQDRPACYPHFIRALWCILLLFLAPEGHQ